MASLSPKQLGKAVGLSESTLKRWIDAGQLRVERTPGGHRRIDQAEAIAFIRAQGLAVKDPLPLGLPEGLEEVGSTDRNEHAAMLVDMVLKGELAKARASIVRSFIDGVPLADLFDQTLKQALCELGELWGCQGQENWEGLAAEHMATDACIQAISEIRSMMPSPKDGAPVAIGMAPQQDPYLLPGLMAGVALSELGFRVINLGPNVPMPAFIAACKRHNPVLGFISITSEPHEHLATELTQAAEYFQTIQAALIVGGQSSGPVFAESNAASADVIRANSIGELRAFARGLRHARPEPKGDPAGTGGA